MFNGFIAENFVANELHKCIIGEALLQKLIFYDGIISVEVKSSLRTQSKSLNVFLEKYSSYGYENSIRSIPLYVTFCFKKND